MVKISLKSLVASVKSCGKKLSATLFTSFDCEFARNSIHPDLKERNRSHSISRSRHAALKTCMESQLLVIY